MLLRRLIPVFLLCARVAAAQEHDAPVTNTTHFAEIVLPLSDFKIAIHKKPSIKFQSSLNPLSFAELIGKAQFGTAFCVDPACRFVGTNYHVAKDLDVSEIRGEPVIHKYLGTGPNDDGAVLNETFRSALEFTASRDLAMFELRRPLHKSHGMHFSLEELQEGQEVDIYAYSKQLAINSRRKLEQFQGIYKGTTPNGLIAVDYGLCADGKPIGGGSSGGIVVDRRSQQIVGILSGIAEGHEHIALAVSSESLLEFVSQVQPYLAQRIFPQRMKAVSPVAPDLYPQFVEPASHFLQERPEETADVRMLRMRGQALADSIRNFIAVQTFAWGSEANQEPVAAAAYEIRVIDGFQRFSDGKEQFANVPLPPRPSVSFATGGEWAELPEWIGTKLNLKIHQAADAVVNEQPMKVFQYNAVTEDRLCMWDTQVDYGILTSHHVVDVPVHGEIWTDKELNILRISEHCELPANLKWKDYQAVVTYGWLNRGEQPQLIPVTIYADVKYKNKLYWCRGLFTDYKVFSARARIIGN